MAEQGRGFIKIYRDIVDWGWYGDANTARLFIHLIITANYTEKAWRGHIIKRGQRAVSLENLSTELNLSIQNIRTAIAHLKQTGEITSEATKECTIFTVVNYSKFQDVANETANE